jgi:hypothetical protein
MDDAITVALLADAAGAAPTADCIASIDAASQLEVPEIGCAKGTARDLLALIFWWCAHRPSVHR